MSNTKKADECFDVVPKGLVREKPKGKEGRELKSQYIRIITCPLKRLSSNKYASLSDRHLEISAD